MWVEDKAPTATDAQRVAGANGLVNRRYDLHIRQAHLSGRARRIACLIAVAFINSRRLVSPNMVFLPLSMPSVANTRNLFYFFPEPGSAILRCCSASMPAGVMLAIADCTLFFKPLTTSPSPQNQPWRHRNEKYWAQVRLR
jgi:hypothetical protein